MACQVGTFYDIELRYRSHVGAASVQLAWQSPSTTRAVIPATHLYSYLSISTGAPWTVTVAPAAIAPATTTAHTVLPSPIPTGLVGYVFIPGW